MHWHLIFLVAALASTHGLISSPTKSKARCPSRVLKGGRVRIRSKGRVIRYVCSPGYQLLGNKYSTCIRGRWDSPVPVCIKGGCDSFNVPFGQVLETYRGAFATIHCDPGYLLVGNQGLYCNGAVWNDTLPICREIGGAAKKECDFESEDLCGWTHDTNQDFNWKRHNFATPSGYIGTGPSYDHTLGRGLNGHYMYLESSSPRLENDTARLYSPVFKMPATESSCFIFWYHMFGHSTGSLNVYRHGKDSELLFTKSGDQGDLWLEAVLPLPLSNSTFQILIEGVRGNGYEGDIAIDDVKLAEGDECIVPTTISDVGLEGSSCEQRCFIATTDPSMCECTPDCFANRTCCPDYLQFCAGTTEVSEWPSSESETETSTFDDISTFPTFAPEEVYSSTTSKLNTPTIMTKEDSVSRSYRTNVRNSTSSLVHTTPTLPVLFYPSTKKSVSSTFEISVSSSTLPWKFTTLKPQTNDFSIKTVTNSSYNSNIVTKRYSSTVPKVYNTIFPINVSKTTQKIEKPVKLTVKSSTSTPAKTSMEKLTTYFSTLAQTKLNLTYSKSPYITQSFTLITDTEKINYSLPSKQISSTQTYQQNIFVHKNTSTSADPKSKGTLWTSTTVSPTKQTDTRKSTFSSTSLKPTQLHQRNFTSEQTTSVSPNSKNKGTSPITDRRKVSFPSDVFSSTQTHQQNTLVKQSTTVSPDSKNKWTIRTTTISPFTEKTEIKKISLPTTSVSSTQTYPTKPVVTRSTSKLFSISSSPSMTYKIIFNTPPVVIFRAPKFTTHQQSSVSVPTNTPSTTIISPKFLKNSTKKEMKSINDILYHGWNKSNPTALSAVSRPTVGQNPSLMTTLTTLPPSSTSRSSLSTVLSMDYDNEVENTWRSKIKPNNNKDPAPKIAPLTRTSNEAERISVWVCFVLLVLSTVLISVCIIKKRKRTLRTDEDDEMDITFLAADEMLDFTLSRPDISEEKIL